MTGRALTGDAAVSAATQGLSRFFDVSPVVLLPPAIALTFALFKVDILIVIAAGIASAVPLCLCVQDMGPSRYFVRRWQGIWHRTRA